MGDLTQAVDRFFDRAGHALPVFVPALPSMAAGALVSIVVFLVGGRDVWEDKRRFADSPEIVKRYRWVLLLGLLLAVCNLLNDFVATTIYRIANLKQNKQHITNIHWLREYNAALA